MSIYSINGEIESKYDGQSIMLFTFDHDTIRSVDTTYIQNGKFYFSGKEYIKDFSLLSLGNYPDTVISQNIILENGNINVSIGELSKVSGTYLNDSYESYLTLLSSYNRECQLIMSNDSINEIEKKRRSRLETNNLLKDIHETMIKNVFNIVGTFVFKHYIQAMPDDYFDELIDVYQEKIADSPEMQKSISFRNKLRDQNKLVGTKFLDFELETPEGEMRKISDYVGKSEYLFIDFWASWCGPCIREIPEVKDVYKKYHEKGLSVLGISLDDRKEDWVRALSRIDASWDHLLATGGMSSEIAEYYNIKSIPFTMLLDKRGSIIQIGLRGKDLNHIMEQLLKEKIN